MQQFSVHIVDPSRLFREGLKRLFESGPFSVVAESADLTGFSLRGEEAGRHPDFLLIEWARVDPALSDAVSSIVRNAPRLRIVALANTVDPHALADALRSGVRGYLLKDISPDALLHSLLLMETGEMVFPSELASILVSTGLDADATETLDQAPDAPLFPRQAFDTLREDPLGQTLSRRETEILHGLIEGQSNKSIARKLDVAEGTVKVHLKSLLRKIKARNRTQAAIWGLNHGVSGHGVPGNGFSGNGMSDRSPSRR